MGRLWVYEIQTKKKRKLVLRTLANFFSAVMEARYKKGHIILIGFHCQHRAQSHGTYKLLFNALLYSEYYNNESIKKVILFVNVR